MARLKTLQVGVLNIKIHPHSTEKYIQLMKDVFKLAAATSIRGSSWGMPRELYPVDVEDNLQGMYGSFYKFLQINKNDPWLDIKSRELVITEEGQPIPQVAENLKPNTKEILFFFNPKPHRFFFDRSLISPNGAKKMLDGCMNQPEINNKYGQIFIEIESSEEVLERILRIPLLTKLEINFTRPNFDDMSEYEADVMSRMEKQNIVHYNETMKAPRNESLNPDDKTKALMNVAKSNGHVDAEGFDGDEKVVESTVPHPLIKREKYDPDKQSPLSAMRSLSSRFFKSIRKN